MLHDKTIVKQCWETVYYESDVDTPLFVTPFFRCDFTHSLSFPSLFCGGFLPFLDSLTFL